MAIVFDLDETLISTSYRQYRVLCALFPDLKLSNYNDYEILRFKKSLSNYKWVSKYIKELSRELYIGLYTPIIENPKYLKHDSLKVDLNLLEKLVYHEKKKLILVSLRKNEKNGLDQLKNLKLFPYFSEIHFVKHNELVNPKVDVIRKLKSKYNIEGYIGDSFIDFEAAEINNVPFLPVHSTIHNTFGEKGKDVNHWINKIINE